MPGSAICMVSIASSISIFSFDAAIRNGLFARLMYNIVQPMSLASWFSIRISSRADETSTTCTRTARGFSGVMRLGRRPRRQYPQQDLSRAITHLRGRNRFSSPRASRNSIGAARAPSIIKPTSVSRSPICANPITMVELNQVISRRQITDAYSENVRWVRKATNPERSPEQTVIRLRDRGMWATNQLGSFTHRSYQRATCSESSRRSAYLPRGTPQKSGRFR